MDQDSAHPVDLLRIRGLKPSHQRIRVLERLLAHRDHPTADRIFRDLKVHIPSLSKSTVYHILDSFRETGLVRVLSIDDNEARFDIQMEVHGHFRCTGCGAIHNFPIRLDDLVPEDSLRGFRVVDRIIQYKGLCPACLGAGSDVGPGPGSPTGAGAAPMRRVANRGSAAGSEKGAAGRAARGTGRGTGQLKTGRETREDMKEEGHGQKE